MMFLSSGTPRHYGESKGRCGIPLLLILLLFLFVSCTTTKPLSQNDFLPSADIEWSELKAGYEITNQKIPGLGVSWTCVKIDLSQLEVTPVIKISEKPFKVKNFALQNNLTVAVNTTPFAKNGSMVKTQGIIKDNGNLLAEPIEKYCALAIRTDKDGTLKCTILKNQTSAQIEQYDYAIGGFFVILWDGQIQNFAQTRRSRTACGIDDTGNILFLFAVTPDFSLTDKNGLSYSECAAILQTLGCTQAMQFDGGHSTSMVVEGKIVESPVFPRKVATAPGI